MSRSHYVVTYDVSDDKRRDRIHKTLSGFGDWVQYSVFFCELNEQEVVRMRAKLRGLVNHAEDQVLIIEVGRSVRSFPTAVEVVGRAYTPATRTLVV